MAQERRQVDREPDAWVTLNAERAWMRGLQAISPFDVGWADWWGLLLAIPLTIIYFIVLALLIGLVRRPQVNLRERKLRVGRRTFDFTDIALAELSPPSRKRSELMFGLEPWPKLYVPLAERSVSVLNEQSRDALKAVIEGSSVAASQKAIALEALSK